MCEREKKKKEENDSQNNLYIYKLTLLFTSTEFNELFKGNEKRQNFWIRLFLFRKLINIKLNSQSFHKIFSKKNSLPKKILRENSKR